MPRTNEITKAQIAAMMRCVLAHQGTVDDSSQKLVETHSVRVKGKYDGELVTSQIIGDSLKDAGIFNNDWAVIELTNEAQDGQLVYVQTPAGIVGRFFYGEADGTIRLESRNRKYPPNRLAAHQVTILGIVREVVRQLS